MFYSDEDFYPDELEEFCNLKNSIKFGTVEIDSERDLESRFVKGKETPFLKYFAPGKNKTDE